VPQRLRYFPHRDADLQGAALGEFLRVVEKQLRAYSPGSGPSARSVHSPLRVDAPCLPALPLRRNRRRVRRRRRGPGRLSPPGSMRTPSPTCKSACGGRLLRVFVRRGLLAGADAGDGAMGIRLASPWTARCASRPLTARGASVCCVTAPAGRLPGTATRTRWRAPHLRQPETGAGGSGPQILSAGKPSADLQEVAIGEMLAGRVVYRAMRRPKG
jgi:hypothetical protein